MLDSKNGQFINIHHDYDQSISIDSNIFFETTYPINRVGTTNNSNNYKLFNDWQSTYSFDLNSKIEDTDSCQTDCNNIFMGSAFIDSCNTCAAGSTGISPILDPNACLTTSDAQFKNDIKIYPNPFKSSTIIELPSMPHLLSVYDIIGNKLRENYVSGRTIIKKEELTKGMYILEIRSNSQTYSVKLIAE